MSSRPLSLLFAAALLFGVGLALWGLALVCLVVPPTRAALR